MERNVFDCNIIWVVTSISQLACFQKPRRLNLISDIYNISYGEL